jgi:hypothetical protein
MGDETGYKLSELRSIISTRTEFPIGTTVRTFYSRLADGHYGFVLGVVAFLLMATVVTSSRGRLTPRSINSWEEGLQEMIVLSYIVPFRNASNSGCNIMFALFNTNPS